MARKLYLFNHTQVAGLSECYSISDTGDILGTHICSGSEFMYTDLVFRPSRKKTIDEYFEGELYEVIQIPDNEVTTHPGLLNAIELNREAGRKNRRQAEINLGGWIEIENQYPPENTTVWLLANSIMKIKATVFNVDNEVMKGYYYITLDKMVGNMDYITHWRPYDETI